MHPKPENVRILPFLLMGEIEQYVCVVKTKMEVVMNEIGRKVKGYQQKYKKRMKK